MLLLGLRTGPEVASSVGSDMCLVAREGLSIVGVEGMPLDIWRLRRWT